MRWLAAPLAAALFVLGVWVAGGVITDSFKVSMALTALWGALFGASCLAIAVKSPSLRVPVLGGFLVSAVVVGGYLGLSTLRDRVVDERVATARPGTGNVRLAGGSVESLEHESSGRATVVRVRGGERKLTLTRFSTSAGPDLRVRLVPGDGSDGDADGARDLGALKGNRGNQQYDIPADIDLGRHRSVLIWCRAFSAGFAKASLAPA